MSLVSVDSLLPFFEGNTEKVRAISSSIEACSEFSFFVSSISFVQIRQWIFCQHFYRTWKRESDQRLPSLDHHKCMLFRRCLYFPSMIDRTAKKTERAPFSDPETSSARVDLLKDLPLTLLLQWFSPDLEKKKGDRGSQETSEGWCDMTTKNTYRYDVCDTGYFVDKY